jgi:ABC-type enterochelin transport system permease subunit
VSEDRKFANAAQTAVITAAVAVAESVVAYFWLAERLTASLALAAHAAVSVGMALWTGFAPSARKDPRLPVLTAVSTAALGPLGAVGSLLTLLLARRYMRRALPFDEWYRGREHANSESSRRA